MVETRVRTPAFSFTPERSLRERRQRETQLSLDSLFLLSLRLLSGGRKAGVRTRLSTIYSSQTLETLTAIISSRLGCHLYHKREKERERERKREKERERAQDKSRLFVSSNGKERWLPITFPLDADQGIWYVFFFFLSVSQISNADIMSKAHKSLELRLNLNRSWHMATLVRTIPRSVLSHIQKICLFRYLKLFF